MQSRLVLHNIEVIVVTPIVVSSETLPVKRQLGVATPLRTSLEMISKGKGTVTHFKCTVLIHDCADLHSISVTKSHKLMTLNHVHKLVKFNLY